MTTHRLNWLKSNHLDDKSYSLLELSKLSNIPLDILQQVYNRGIGAYKTNPQSVRMKDTFKKYIKAPLSKKLSKEQWAFSRVYSFLDNNPKHDNDLREHLIGGNKELDILEATPLGDDDIRRFLPNSKILKYSKLSNIENIEDLLKHTKDYAFILYEDSPNSGHWICISRPNDESLEFFDSYGGSPDSQQKWVSKKTRQMLGEGKPYLSKLFDKSPLKTYYNDIKYQGEGKDIASCGRHCTNRIFEMLDGKNLKEYYQFMKTLSKENNMNFDELVCSIVQ